MATTTKKTTSATRKTTSTVKSVDKSVADEKITEAKKEFANNDGILCKSLVTGLLLVEGKKSGILYQWADYNDAEEIEYQDLSFMVKSHDKTIFEPRIVIEDEEFLSQYPEIASVYDGLYSVGELEEIFNLPPGDIKATIESLPNGVRESVKNLAATMIDRGRLDSVQKIRVLDEVFGTQLLLTLVDR